MTDEQPVLQDRLAALKAATTARIFLPTAGSAVATRASLAFQLAHANARDAVEDRLDAEALADKLRARGLEAPLVESAATSRRAYLMRPDLGRRLAEPARARLLPLAGDDDLFFVVADGLSARAVEAHALALLDAALPLFRAKAWKIGPVVVVSQGRVAIGDEIGALLGAKLVVVLIGERPGLSSPDSLGAYLTFAPRIGCVDAERNCLSNIRREGMGYAEAAARLFYLATEALRRKASGVALKDEFGDTDSAPLLDGHDG
ncbi:ethanolamine ammonia-lyase subunit EutC [Methylocystis bryophila]|uniref:ethanolamine ammonia-lyase subunit EutC n=1 Tax=Methylocystis bryophila TaxID=655015 RepID=UPI003DB1AE96